MKTSRKPALTVGAVVAGALGCVVWFNVGSGPEPAAAAPTTSTWKIATKPGPVPDWSRPKQPSPCTADSPRQDCITASEARRRIEAAGRSWADFTATTTIRPRYETVFVRLWLAP